MSVKLGWIYPLENSGKLIADVKIIDDRTNNIPSNLKHKTAPYIAKKLNDGGIFAFWPDGSHECKAADNLRLRINEGRPGNE